MNFKLGDKVKDWTEATDEPDVLVCPPSEFNKRRKKQIWLDAYIAYMVEAGFDEESARSFCKAGEDTHDYDANPLDAAYNDLQILEQD